MMGDVVLWRVQNDLPTEEGMSYLQVKNHALLTYTKLELFFALLKVRLVSECVLRREGLWLALVRGS